MLIQTWNYIFKVLIYGGCLGVVLYYIKPRLFENIDPTRPAPLVYITGIYILVWVVVGILWYFFSAQESATVMGLWSIKPTGAEYYDNGKMVAAKDRVDLLTETQVVTNLGESFTFSFFLSIDNSGIETVKGTSLRSDGRPYQNLIVIPGAYTVAVDPLHEVLKLNFVAHDSNSYEVLIPTLSIHRWHQILVTIEGRTADIYQNGLLIKSVPLPNVISGRPGKPLIYMNTDMYTRVAYIQAWPRRILEKEVADNYRLIVTDQNVPPLPSTELFGIPKFNFCLGGLCFDSSKPNITALTHVEYTYA